jgi:imidazolonepropionase-like amidohydrolase
MQPYVSEQAPVIALVHARVIDGTGAGVRHNRTLLLEGGIIRAEGADGEVSIPNDARVIDLRGQTVLPGLVQMHEHLWMYAGSVLSVPRTYPKLFLAAGVTTIRTAGSYNPYVDLRTRNDIDAGNAVGPRIDLTIYMDLFGAPRLKDAEATRKYLSFWLDSGFTSVKAYAYTEPVALRTAIEVAHERGVKVTGHLCAVTYAEAAAMGIDNVEHGFAMNPDMAHIHRHPAKEEPEEEGDTDRSCSLNALRSLVDAEATSDEATALIRTLVEHGVAVTSTLPALEDLAVGIPEQHGVELLPPVLQDIHRKARAGLAETGPHFPLDSVRKSAEMERKFMLSGGLLLSGSDPAVPSGGVIAGYGSLRQLELMVEHGFTPLEAIRVSTLNGAIYLDQQDRIGSVEVGKLADLLVVAGDPSRNISDIRKATIVFKDGIGYAPEKLRDAVRGRVGLE